MPKEIDKAALVLSDTRAPWVDRRDAADLLGSTAEQAVRALQQCRQEKDVDVKAAAERALGRASAALAGAPSQRGYALDELAQACAKNGERTVERDGEAYVVSVKTSEGRSQRVTICISENRRGLLLTLSTRCGKATPDKLDWALRLNADLALGAVALVREGEEDCLVLKACYLPDEATPREIKASVKELAFAGDWMEQRLSGAEDVL